MPNGNGGIFLIGAAVVAGVLIFQQSKAQEEPMPPTTPETPTFPEVPEEKREIISNFNVRYEKARIAGSSD